MTFVEQATQLEVEIDGTSVSDIASYLEKSVIFSRNSPHREDARCVVGVGRLRSELAMNDSLLLCRFSLTSALLALSACSDTSEGTKPTAADGGTEVVDSGTSENEELSLKIDGVDDGALLPAASRCKAPSFAVSWTQISDAQSTS